MNILGIIPARGGSKGILRKNVKLLNGKPLLQYAVEAARASEVIDRVILSTDDLEIASVGRAIGAEVPFIRPAHLAADNSLMIDVVTDAVLSMEKSFAYRADVIVLLQPTSPFRTRVHIDAALKIFMDIKPDTVVSTVKVPHHFTPESIYRQQDGRLVPYSQDIPVYDRKFKPAYLARNGPAVLVSSRETIMNGSFYGNLIVPYEMDERSSIDIDTPFDFMLAELLMQHR
jgi:CMP-N-acetylneuraminic acid synthetase